MKTDFFPQGVATGKAFLGRKKESNVLKTNIETGHHTLLIAPRRYGKTSLARHVLGKLKIPHEEINFYLARSAIAVERKIRETIQKALANRLGKLEQVTAIIKNFFNNSQQKWTLGLKGVAELELIPTNEANATNNIFTVLNLLESVMQAMNKKIVLFFDEVQEIDLLKEAKEIQGAIREFAQQTKSVNFVFSGSNRRLLHHMFDDSSMPLYELCERLKLNKIDKQLYKKYINMVAIKTYKKKLADDTIEAIFTISECHPKRIYNLCYQLWLNFPKAPFSTQDVEKCWNDFVQLRLTDTRLKLSKLNSTQLKVLTLIAINFDKPISGKESQRKLNLTSPSIVNALKSLFDEGLITSPNDKQYSITDPLIKTVLSTYERQNVE